MIESSPKDWPRSTNPSRNDPPANSVGIVIPMRDGLKFFKLCLHSVLNFTDHPYMLCVIDNQSGFETRRYLRSATKNHSVNVLRYDAEFNFSAQVNMGLKYVFSFPGVRYGLILNADAIVEPFWLSKLVQTINARANIGMVGPISNIAIPEQQGALEDRFYTSERLSGFCMLIRKNVFEVVGGFDESFAGGGFEDWDFCVRAGAAGWASVVDKRTYVFHFWKMFRRLDPFADRQMEDNRRLFYAKHPKLAEQIIMKSKLPEKGSLL